MDSVSHKSDNIVIQVFLFKGYCTPLSFPSDSVSRMDRKALLRQEGLEVIDSATARSVLPPFASKAFIYACFSFCVLIPGTLFLHSLLLPRPVVAGAVGNCST